jgi:acyl-[acyl-carrier-protein] desaturase
MTARELPEVLEEAAGTLLAQHTARAREWFPHELVPWEIGRAYVSGGPVEPTMTLAPGVASALWVNLLTEDNLPHYFHTLAAAFAYDTAMGEWSRRWAAEEQRHAIALRDWVCLTRTLDPVALERARMAQVSIGFRPLGRARSLCDGLVYLTLQELATRVSHWNTGALLDPTGTALMRRIAADENLHHLFYWDLVTEAIALDPSGAVVAIDRQVTGFEMPGTGLDGFRAHAAAIAAAGIYDYRVHLRSVVLPVVVGNWRVFDLGGLDAAAEAARDHLAAHLARLERVADRMETQARGASGDGAVPATGAALRAG